MPNFSPGSGAFSTSLTLARESANRPFLAHFVKPSLDPHLQRPELRCGHVELTADLPIILPPNIIAIQALAFSLRKAEQQILHDLHGAIGDRDVLPRPLFMLNFAHAGREVRTNVLHQPRWIAKVTVLNAASHSVQYVLRAAIHLRGWQFASYEVSYPAAQKLTKFLHSGGISVTNPIDEGSWGDVN